MPEETSDVGDVDDTSTTPPSPLVGEGARSAGEGGVPEAVPTDRPPHPVLADHLLPRGEKEVSTAATDGTLPSLLVGEGARRAGEGDVRRVSARLKGFARNMRHEPTEAEQHLWALLRDRRLIGHKFRRQVPIGPYIADFVCYSSRLIVELDGSQHAQSTRDVERDAELKRRGFTILRVWNNDLTHNRDAVLDAVWHGLQETLH